MKNIYVYPDGSAAVIDTDNEHIIGISSQVPVSIEDCTNANMLKYFGISLEDEKENQKISIK